MTRSEDCGDRGAAETGAAIHASALAKRLSELSAVYDLTDRLYRAESRDDIYQAALDAICNALGCERASILLFDDQDIMRFVAWRGLSDAYRAAVEGHTPWKRDERDARPVIVEKVADAELATDLKTVVIDERIGALSFIPLVVERQLVGKFMAYYSAAHSFTEGEIDIAVTIARQLGFAVERLRAEELRRHDEETKELLIAETIHRIKNTLGTVQSIASQTFRQAPAEERQAFTARIQALANAHDLMTRRNWQRAPVADIVSRAIAPFDRDASRVFSVSGSQTWLDSSNAVLLAMALHELGTNAAKYGALSSRFGRVSVSWQQAEADGERSLKFVWRETGGPQVSEPTRKGFGTNLIERLLAGESEQPCFEYVPAGLICRFGISL